MQIDDLYKIIGIKEAKIYELLIQLEELKKQLGANPQSPAKEPPND